MHDVTNLHRVPDDRQAVIDVQNAIKKRGCYALAHEAWNAESANLDRTLAKRLMDKGIRL